METRSMKRKIREISLQKKKRKVREISPLQEPLKVQEDSSSSSSKMEFPLRYDYEYLSLCESICRGKTDLGTGLGTSWDGPFWDKFAKFLNNHCDGNRITEYMCQQHLKRYRTIKQTILKPERASRANLGYVRDLDENFKTRLVRMLNMSSPSIRLGGSSSKSKSQSSGSKGKSVSSGSKGKSVDSDAKSNMADLLSTFFSENHITLAEHMTLEQTLLKRAISCKAVLKLKNYNEQLQRVEEFLKTLRGGGGGGGGGGGSGSGSGSVAVGTEDVEAKKLRILQQQGVSSHVLMACNLCDVVFNDPAIFNSHLAGEKHAAMVLKSMQQCW